MDAMQVSPTTPEAPEFMIVPSSYTSSTATTCTIQYSRTRALHDVGFVKDVPLEALLATVLPAVPREHISGVIGKLIQDNAISQDGWVDFQTPPREQDVAAHVVFQAFETMFLDVLQADKFLFPDCPSSNLMLGVHSNRIPHSDWPNDTRPGGSIHLNKTCLPYKRESILIGGVNVDLTDDGDMFSFLENILDSGMDVDLIDPADICCFLEFKRNNSPANFKDDTKRLVYNVRYRFLRDPRCRFVFGLTIEDTSTRFWSFSRSGILVSERFDLNEQKEFLVHIFLALARGSLEQLGFDTTVRCVEPTEQSRGIDGDAHRLWDLQKTHEFDVHANNDKHGESVARIFSTVRCLYNYGAAQVCGQGTRVYEVTEIDRLGVSYVLKDYWLERGRKMEGDLLMEIRKQLEVMHPEFLQHFLEVECYGGVMLNNSLDIVSPFVRRQDDSGLQSRRNLRNKYGKEMGHSYSSVHGSKNDQSHDPLQHHRIVFKGAVGVPIRELEIKQAFDALHGGLMGLLGMYRLGFIHRDISCGNILLVNRETGPVGVLIDLEHAKVFPDSSGKVRDRRTGTREFMANEVHLQSSLWTNNNTVAWFHNPIHDIESIWWIALWCFFYLKGDASENNARPPFYERRSSLFPTSGTGTRLNIWTYPSEYRTMCEGLPRRVKEILYSWLLCLKTAYEESQQGFKDSSYRSFDYGKVFDSSIEFLEKIQEGLESEE